MGTFAVISAWGKNRAALNQAMSRAFEEMQRVDSLLSLHRPDSELSALNAPSGGVWRAVSEDMYEVLTLAQTIATETHGAFDISIGPLADLWGFIWKEYRLPTDSELDQVLPKVNWRQLHLDADRRAIRLLVSGASIDLGGIGKGYAVDRAMAVLGQHSVKSALVRIGGDVRVSAPPPGHEHWPIQLEDPGKTGQRQIVGLAHQALSTSGDYENYFEIDGRRYSHLLDPRTGYPVSGVASCSLTAATCAESDAWATACFVLGADQAMAQFGKRFGIRFTLSPAPGGKETWQILQTESFPAAYREP